MRTEEFYYVKVMDYGLEVQYPLDNDLPPKWIKKSCYKKTAELMEKVKVFNFERKQQGLPEFNLEVIGTCTLIGKNGVTHEEPVMRILIYPEVIAQMRDDQVFDFNLIPKIADRCWIHPALKIE